MMDRFEFLQLLMVAPAMARQALTEGKWLTIAAAGWNRNNRKYSEAALASMAEDMTGKLIIKRLEGARHIPTNQGLLELAVGVVTAARRGEAGSVQVQVKWFGAAGKVEGVLCPAGLAHRYQEVRPGWFEVNDYEAQCLELSEWSGWEEASKV